MLDIYTLGDEVLREPTEEIKEFDSALKMLVDAMFDTLDEADGIGLAGPQVGVSKRIFIVDLHQGEKGKYVFINPVITETSVEVGPYEEGCLSIPGLFHDVIRPLKVKCQAQDINGKFFRVDADGILARVIQHENDHLYGKLYIDRLDDKDKEKMEKLYEKRQKRNSKRK